MKKHTAKALVTILPFLLAGRVLAQAPTAELPPVVARYEQMLFRTPEKGTAFDKVYQHFFEGEGLEKLTERWQALATGENEAPYSLLLGLLAERRGLPVAARAAYTRATKLTPNDFQAWKALGTLEASEGKMPAAIEAFQKALDAKPPESERAALYRSLAQSQQRHLDGDAALATWQKMATEFPDDPFVLEEVADAQVDAEKFEEAKATYNRLRELAGTDPFKRVTATIRLAQVEERQGKTKEALAIYEGALPLASDTSWIHREVRSRIEEIYRRQDDLPGLVGYYEKWLEGHDKDVEAAIRLSSALGELNRKAQAVTWLQKAAEWAPDRREVQIALARALRETDQTDAAVKLLTSLTQSFPDELSYWELRGEAEWDLFLKAKEEALKKAALASWEKLAPAETKDAGRVSRLADLLKAHDLSEEALIQYERAAKLAPEAGELRERWAGYLFALKRDDQAWAVLDGLVSAEATASSYRRLALMQKKYGRPEAALESIKKGCALEPNDFSLLALQWRLLSDAGQWEAATALYEPMFNAAPAMHDQIETQYIQALNALNRIDTEREKLTAKLTAASERELRLLIRLSLQADDLPGARAALDEGKKRFEASLPLALMESQYQRQVGDLEGRVAALRTLIKLEPKQTGDFLKEIARAYQEQENWVEALTVAEECITASPASTEMRLFYADLSFAAGKSEQGIAALREAIKLSDKPNQVRQRLARVYDDNGEIEAARQVMEEAFEAETEASAKLALVRPLGELYFQQGRIETLISRFRDRQRAEEGGWRYALYLAELFQQMQDYGQAREELAKGLASRPKDPGLLRQLLRLTEMEGNLEEQVRYRRALAEVEPSVENRVGLAEALANNGDTAGAMQMLIDHQSEVISDPSAWRDVFAKVQKEKRAQELSNALEEALRQRPDDFKSRLALTEMQLSLGQMDEAAKMLWDLRAMPKPLEAPTPATTPASPAFTGFNYPGGAAGVSRPINPMMLRTQVTYHAEQTFEQLLASGPRFGSRRRYYYHHGISMAPKPSQNFESARDTALVYLAAIAVRQNKAEAFLADLEKALASNNADRQERLIAYSLVQARVPLLQEIKKQADTVDGDPILDEFCLNMTQGYLNIDPNAGGVDADAVVAKACTEKLSPRVEKRAAGQAGMTQYQQALRLIQQGKAEEGKPLMKQWLATLNEKDPAQISMAVHASLAIGETDRAEKYARMSLADKKNSGGRNAYWLLNSIAQSYLTANQVDKATKLYAELFVEALPAKPGASPKGFGFGSSHGMGLRSTRGFVRHQSAPYPTRFIDQQLMQVLQHPFQVLKGADKVKPFFEAFETIKVREELAIYPQLALVYLRWWNEERAEALEAARKVLAAHPDDELRLMVAGMEAETEKLPEAIATLSQITTRQGDLYKQTQLLLVDYGKRAKDEAAARKAALRLLSLRLNREELDQLLPDLKQLGMTQKAEEVEKRATRTSNRRDPYRVSNLMQQYRNENKETEALGLARSVLAQDPMANRQNRNDDHNRRVALDTLKHFKALDAYIGDLTKQAAEDPKSLRLTLLLAEAWNREDSKRAVEWYRKAVEINPEDMAFKMTLAQNLQNSDQAEAALAIYGEVLEKNPSLVFEGSYDFIYPYQRAKKLPDLAKAILKIEAGPGVIPNNQSPEWFCARLAQELENQGHRDLTISIYRKGLELLPDNLGSGATLRLPLIDALHDQGDKEETIRQIEEFFFPAAPKQKALLGLNRGRSHNHWFSHVNHTGNGALEIPALRTVRTAVKLGIEESLLAKAKERAESDPTMEKLIVAIRLEKRDPNVIEELTKLAEEPLKPNSSLHLDMQFYEAMSGQVSGWPEARNLASRLLAIAVKFSDKNPQDYHQRMRLRMRVADEANSPKELAVRQKALKEWLEIQGKMGRNSVGGEVFRAAKLMIASDLPTECEKLLQVAKNASNFRSGYRRQFAELEAELALAKGEIAAPMAVCGLADGMGTDGKSTLFWELGTCVVSPFQRDQDIVVAARDYSKLDKRFDVEILYMIPPNTVKRLALIPKAKARGTWKGAVPEGLGFLMAVLHAPGGDRYVAPWTPIQRSPNLLSPLTGAEVNGSAPGWEKLANGSWSVKADVPYPGATAVAFSLGNNNRNEALRSEKIPVEKGKEYFQSGWIYSSGNNARLGVRFLDQNDNEVGNQQCYNYRSVDGSWVYYTQSLTTASRTRDNQRSIPKNAAFMQVVIQNGNEGAIHALHLGVSDIKEPQED